MTLSPSTDDSPRPAEAPPATFREVRYEVSRDFVPILAQAGISLLVSTYQAGKLVVVGAGRGELTLAFHNFEQAMGLALSPAMLAVGTRNQVWLLAREAGMASQLPGNVAHDDCYLARRSHFTGQIHIHELAWGGADGGELWLVNTLFSCLATLDDRHSFVPRWRPKFITGLAAQDRCHLNGLAMEGGRPKYVTAMSETDTPQGWRPTKIHSGCVIDVASGETIARGLAMPHSPRLAGGRLWVLNSGLGDISYVEPDSGQIVSVEQVPGYTRGLAFHGPLAFVGMSRIRETSTFGGVPIAERRDELRCGVAVIDMRQGKAVAYIEFKSGVEEIFAVEVVPNARCPFISGPSPTDDDTSAVWMVPQMERGRGGEWEQGTPGFESRTLALSSSRPLPPQSSPQTAEQWNDHGGRLMEQHEYDAAEAAFRKAIELKPTLGAAWANLAFLTADRGQTEEGRRLYSIAHGHQPSPQLRLVEATVLPPIFQDQRHIESAREKFTSEVAKLVADHVTIDPTRTTTPTYFFLAYQGENDRDLMAQLARVTPSPRSRPIEPRPRAKGERIRLGMLSHFFCNHTIGQLNVGLIEQLDRRRFELVILASGGADDALARRIRSRADRYVAVPADIRTALALVAGQELDVLHFPDLGMSPFTFTLAHSRLAPVQTVTWGHPVTTGLPTIDHFISCQHGETTEADAHYSERLVRLSRLNVCLERPRRSGAPRERAYFGLNDSGHVYACPQSAFKFHPEFDEVLAGILRGDPAGVVPIIEPKYPQWQKLLEDRWRKSMPDVADRLRFVRRIPRTDFLELLACSDVMLDPFPFGGGHSSYEALALGLPVVTLAGRFLRGSLTYAMYQQMGYHDLIAGDKSDYVRLAIQLGTSDSFRSAARAAILGRCDALYDDIPIVRELEDFWEGALER
jgi:uncharacterized protein (TIGR03032 family)